MSERALYLQGLAQGLDMSTSDFQPEPQQPRAKYPATKACVGRDHTFVFLGYRYWPQVERWLCLRCGHRTLVIRPRTL